MEGWPGDASRANPNYTLDENSMVTFSQLGQAMEFLATNLAGRRYEAIADVCLASESEEDRLPVMEMLPSHRKYRITAIKLLADRHGELDLRLRYQRREFPQSGSDYKVGGHDDGHLHVDFVRVEGGWRLKDVWLCR